MLHGAEVGTKDRYDSTPLFAATKNDHEKVVVYLLGIEGACVDFDHTFVRSLLWWAARGGNAQITDAVLQFAQKRGIRCAAVT